MDENTKFMVSLSASTAANCTPCFEHYFGKAKAVGLKIDEIQEAVDLANQLNKRVHRSIKNRINDFIVREKKPDYKLLLDSLIIPDYPVGLF